MEIKELQQEVDNWIETIGVRYFDERTNALLLTEEIGEFCRLIARRYGEQSFKEKDLSEAEITSRIEEEIGDVLFVLVCLANQMNIDLEEIVEKNIKKKTDRDRKRHKSNPKLM